MKIVICASLDYTPQIKETANKLTQQGHQVTIPKTAEKILNGEVTLEQIKQEKETGEISKRAIESDVIRYYFKKIGEADVVLVLNINKKGIKNYIGGAVLLEIGFAHVLNKKIFLLNNIPDMHYKSEIEAMEPVVLGGDFSKIK